MPQAKEDEGHELMKARKKSTFIHFRDPFVLEILLALDNGSKENMTGKT